MKTVTVWLSGCDDSTSVDMKVTEAQFRFLEKLEAAINEASDYGCQPTMSVYADES